MCSGLSKLVLIWVNTSMFSTTSFYIGTQISHWKYSLLPTKYVLVLNTRRNYKVPVTKEKYLQLSNLGRDVPHQTLTKELHPVWTQELRQRTHLCKYLHTIYYKLNQRHRPNGERQVKLRFRKKMNNMLVPEMSEYSSALKVSSFSVGRLTKAFMAGK